MGKLSPSDQILAQTLADALLEQLEVDTPEVDLQVNRVVGTNSIRTKKVIEPSIQDSRKMNMHQPKSRLHTHENTTPLHMRILHTYRQESQWKHLSQIADKRHHRSDVDIGLLIGCNVPAAFQPINVIFGKDEEPWEEQYQFGVTVIGCVCKDKQQTQNSASVNRATVERQMLLDCGRETSRPPPFENVTNTKDLTSSKQVREMMVLDHSEIHGTEQAESIEEKHFGEILTRGLHKNTNGN